MRENFPILSSVIDQIYDILEEERVGKKTYVVKPSTILALAEEKRLERSKNVKLLVVESSDVRKGVKRYDFEAESSEKSEAESHIGYVELVEKSGNIHSLWCDCADFQSRYAFFLEKNHKIADYDKGGDIGSHNEYFDPHTKEFPKIMNPDDALGLACKHLLGALQHIEDNKLVTSKSLGE